MGLLLLGLKEPSPDRLNSLNATLRLFLVQLAATPRAEALLEYPSERIVQDPRWSFCVPPAGGVATKKRKWRQAFRFRPPRTRLTHELPLCDGVALPW